MIFFPLLLPLSGSAAIMLVYIPLAALLWVLTGSSLCRGWLRGSSIIFHNVTESATMLLLLRGNGLSRSGLRGSGSCLSGLRVSCIIIIALPECAVMILVLCRSSLCGCGSCLRGPRRGIILLNVPESAATPHRLRGSSLRGSGSLRAPRGSGMRVNNILISVRHDIIIDIIKLMILASHAYDKFRLIVIFLR